MSRKELGKKLERKASRGKPGRDFVEVGGAEKVGQRAVM